MTHLLPNTLRRLQKLPQFPSVWEGDRRSLSRQQGTVAADLDKEGGEYILWVDTTEGTVRGMDVVAADMGMEALVRTLVRAMEAPHGPAQPSRPQKIVVRDREFQFFLRGALQELGISVDYVVELPLIDEILRTLESMGGDLPPTLPAAYEKALTTVAKNIWQAEPWEDLADHDIIAVELNETEPKTLYLCVMGMLGQEFGILLYRSLESLTQFRQAAIHERSAEQLEQAFLTQDCWFLNYELESEDDELLDESEEIVPLFGSVHPFEGIRPFLDEDEARQVLIALEGFLKFYRQYQDSFALQEIPTLRKRYRLKLATGAVETVTVSTQPELAGSLLAMGEPFGGEGSGSAPRVAVKDSLVPDRAVLSLGIVPWDVIERLQAQPKTYFQDLSVEPKGEGLPIIIVQTSRPKAREMIEAIQAAGGLEAICFNPGADPFSGDRFDIGLLKTGNGELQLFGEFGEDDPTHVQARKKWDQRCKTTKGYCGLIVAMGVTGSSRGNPQLSDMLALFETHFVRGEDLNMGTLQLMPQLDF
jgi:hypothetical protein